MNRNGRHIATILALFLLLPFLAGPARAADRSAPGPLLKKPQVRQLGTRSAGELNSLPVRVHPNTTQAKLAAAMAAVEQSEQKLKAAVASMNAYLDKEAACVGKSWTAQEMEKGCLPQDTLAACKEKLVAACAAGRGGSKAKRWAHVLERAADLSKKAEAIGSVYGGGNKIGSGVGGIGGGIPPLF